MKRALLLFICNLWIITILGQGKPAYKIYNSKGNKVSYSKMLRKISSGDILLFGELHNNPIAHWLQYELTNDLSKKRALILGAEMIESDNQELLDSYLKGRMKEKQFKDSARLWSNYKTDYAPLVNLAKAKKLPFIATNIPRSYAKMVYRNDFKSLDTLSNKAKQWIAPLPIKFDSELKTYKSILKMMGSHGTIKLVKAQAIKDATMAHFILKNYKNGNLFIHFNGSFHSDSYEGILWYLKMENKSLKYVTISTVLQKDIRHLNKEHKGKADFIICIDEDMTSTY